MDLVLVQNNGRGGGAQLLGVLRILNVHVVVLGLVR